MKNPGYILLHAVIRVFLSMSLLGFFAFKALAEENKVLIIESYHATFPWDASYLEGITEILSKGHTLNTFEMDTKRLPADQFQKQADAAWAVYQKDQPNLVIIGDDNALKFLGPQFAKTQTPVVYLGINNNPRAYGVANLPNFTGVLERPLIKRSMQQISSIIPMKNVLVVFDDSTTAQVVKSEIFRSKEKLALGSIQIDLKLIGQFDAIKTLIEQEKNNKTYDAVFIGLYHTVKNSDQSRVPANDVLEWVAQHSPVPLFAFWDFSVGNNKAAGGYVLFGKEQGLMAGELALKMLGKSKDEVIPPALGKKGRYLFSKGQLSKWNIKLPENIKKTATLLD